MNGNGIAASVREGAKSQYDVFSDGKIVFSKQHEDRWPDDGEILSLLRG